MKPHSMNAALCLSASLLLLLSAAARAQESARPCECIPCGGQIECPRGSTGWCECRNNRCHGGCLRNDRDPRRFAASVLTVVTGEASEIQPPALQQNSRQYAQILGSLLAWREDEQTYRIDYGGRRITFVFTAEAASQLGSVLYELQGIAPATPTSKLAGGDPHRVSWFSGQTWKSNGWLGMAVLGLLLALGGYSLFVTLRLSAQFSTSRSQTLDFTERLARALSQEGLSSALRLFTSYQNSHAARVVYSGLRELRMFEEGAEAAPDAAVEVVMNAMRRAIDSERSELQHQLRGLAAVVSFSPWVGVLGLSIGLMNSLNSSATVGLFNSPHFTAGMLMLGLGLGVCIFAKFAHGRLEGEVERIDAEMEMAAEDFAEQIRKNRAHTRPPHA